MLMSQEEYYTFYFSKAEVSLGFTAPSSLCDLLVLKATSKSSNLKVK